MSADFAILRKIAGGTWLAGSLVACREPTQVTVELTTDVVCGERPDTAARVGEPGHDVETRPPAIATTACDTGGRIGSFVVVPSGDKDAPFGVKAVLGRAGRSAQECAASDSESGNLDGCIVARRSLRFLPHTSLVLPIAMRIDCTGVRCDAPSTCVHGACVPDAIDPNVCRGAGCPDDFLLRGIGPMDAGSDTTSRDVGAPALDGGCDGASCFPAPSCATLSATCGPTSSDDCCASLRVPGEPFDLQGQYPVNMRTFYLDKYEVTVGRFRAFVNAVDAGYRPPSGAGKHSHLPRGGLINSYDSNLETGWNMAWNAELATSLDAWSDVVHLSCPKGTWTRTAGANEHEPIDCVDWYEAYAFCVWDGGFLPSYAEIAYVAQGGKDNLDYPWGNTPAPDSDHANYCATADCTRAAPVDVGSKPLGDTRFGQSDVAGNVWEWVLDTSNPARPATCDDCVLLDPAQPLRVTFGGAFDTDAGTLGTGYYDHADQAQRDASHGFRCARAGP